MRFPLVVEAFGIRAGLPLLLRAFPLDRVLQVLTPETRARVSDPKRVARIEALVHGITRRIPATRTTCLKRALLRYALLRRAGQDARFVIGVRRGGRDGFEAHAWVTVRERPVMEPQAPEYRSSFVWPSP